MFTKEQANQIVKRFDSAIYGIRDAGIEGISEIAGETATRIGNRELFTIAKTAEHTHKTPTEFDMQKITVSGPSQFIGAVIIDPEKILTLPKEVFQADLARTIGIASQYPYNGYQQRYRDVYMNALEFQKKWLEQNGIGKIANDPRTENQEELLLNLMGEARYYTDTGIEDWSKAATNYFNNIQGLSHNERTRLLQSAYSVDQFLGMRNSYTSMAHDTAMNIIGNEYLEQDQEQRTEAAAMLLIGISTSAGR